MPSTQRDGQWHADDRCASHPQARLLSKAVPKNQLHLLHRNRSKKEYGYNLSMPSISYGMVVFGGNPWAVPRGRQPQAILRRAAYLIPVVLHHKWCVLLEGRRYGVPWRTLLAHDSDKFRPDYLWLWIVCGEIERADYLHKHRTPHSWEYWANNDDPPTYTPMSDDARQELLADWRAKQRAQGGRDYARRVVVFYRARRDSFGFHPSTRAWVEEQLRAF